MYHPFLLALLTLLFATSPALAETPAPPLKIGVLAFGTLNWELAVIRDEGLDKQYGIAFDTIPLASTEAGRIALQGGSVDMVVSDWIWVAAQRARGLDFSFAPYSSNHGALMVPADSPIRSVADLKGKRLGIAGGGLDKNWLLLRALAQKQHGLDLDKAVDKTFGAPPLLTQALQQGQLDAVLIYWNYAAKLEALGYRQVLDGHGILRGLGMEANVPALGYIFRENWAKSHQAALAGFFKAADEANQRICASEATWRKVAPLTQESDEKVQTALRRHYCAGRVGDFGAAGQKTAADIYALILQTGENKTGSLPDGVFWSPAR